MGCTGSKNQKVAHKIIKKYGTINALQFTLEEEKLQQINQHFPSIKNNLEKNIEQQTKSALKKIDQMENHIQNDYKQRLNKIQKAQKGAVGKAEQIHKQPVDKLFGLDEIRQNLYNLRVNTKISFNNQLQKTQNNVNQKIKSYKSSDLKKFKIEEYEELDKDQKSQVRECLKRNHENRVAQETKQFQKYMEENFNYENFSKGFAKLNPDSELKNIQEKAQKSFNAGQDKVAGSVGCATC